MVWPVDQLSTRGRSFRSGTSLNLSDEDERLRAYFWWVSKMDQPMVGSTKLQVTGKIFDMQCSGYWKPPTYLMCVVELVLFGLLPCLCRLIIVSPFLQLLSSSFTMTPRSKTQIHQGHDLTCNHLLQRIMSTTRYTFFIRLLHSRPKVKSYRQYRPRPKKQNWSTCSCDHDLQPTADALGHFSRSIAELGSCFAMCWLFDYVGFKPRCFNQLHQSQCKETSGDSQRENGQCCKSMAIWCDGKPKSGGEWSRLQLTSGFAISRFRGRWSVDPSATFVWTRVWIVTKLCGLVSLFSKPGQADSQPSFWSTGWYFGS